MIILDPMRLGGHFACSNRSRAQPPGVVLLELLLESLYVKDGGLINTIPASILFMGIASMDIVTSV